MRKLLPLVFSVTLIFMLGMNVNAQEGRTMKVANNQELVEAIETPSVQFIEITKQGYYEFLDMVATSGIVVTKGDYGNNGSRENCNYIITPNDTCFTPEWTNNFARVSTSGSQCPPVNSGTWTVEGQPVGSTINFLDPATQYTMEFEVDMEGAYTLRYTWGSPYNTYAQTEYRFADAPEIVLNGDTEVCMPDSAMLNFDLSWDFAPQNYGIWWELNGNPYDGPDTTDVFYLDVETCGSYTLKVYVENQNSQGDSICAPYSDSINIDFYDEPIVYAGEDDTVCGLTYQLTADATTECFSPTTAWSKVSGPGTATFDFNNVTVTECGDYVFRLTAENGPCTASDDVAIAFRDTPVVDAGPDDETCGLTYSLNPSYTANCDYATEEWTKLSGPGTAYFADNDVEVTECGEYEFIYSVTNYPCEPAEDTVAIDFFTEPTVIANQCLVNTRDQHNCDTVDVCGLSYMLYPDYDIPCYNGVSPTTAWAQIGGPGTATFDGDMATVTECGPYVFEYTVDIGPCSNSDTVWVNYHETPDPEIDGDLIGYVCGTDQYTALDNRTCTNFDDDISHNWDVTGGSIVSGSGTETITVEWDNTMDTAMVTVEVYITDNPECIGYDTIYVAKQMPTIEGQVKYWNEFETYMPTPYPTNINGTTPPDYFYIELYEGTTKVDGYVRVEPNLDPANELLSYWSFTLPVLDYGCDAEFALKIWDGGLLYDPNFPSNGFNRYLGAAYTYQNWGGVNATDALAIQLMATGVDINGGSYNYTWVGPNTLDPDYGYYSFNYADVNTSGGISALDALMANYRAVGLLPNYYHSGSNLYNRNYEVTGRFVDSLPYVTWDQYHDTSAAMPMYNDVPFTHSGEDYLYYDSAVHHKYTSVYIPWEGEANYMNIYYEALGDINASYVPTSGGFPLKAEPSISLVLDNQFAADIEDELSVPIFIDRKASLGAITLDMNYRNDLIEVIGVNYGEDFHYINHEEGIVRIGWFSTETMNVNAGQAIASIKVRVLSQIEPGTRLFELNTNTELADGFANVIDGVTLKTNGVTTDKSAVLAADLSAKNYPNPFKHETIISYVLPEAGDVKVEVFNKMGQHITTIVDQPQTAGSQAVEFSHSDLKPGVYFYKITLDGMSQDYSVTNSMIVIQ